jgi:hypothetical protein
MGTRSFPGVESGRGMMLTPHPLLVSSSKNRIELYLYPPEETSCPVKRVTPNLKHYSPCRNFGINFEKKEKDF